MSDGKPEKDLAEDRAGGVDDGAVDEVGKARQKCCGSSWADLLAL
jgi:hypothetical protein